MPEWTSSGRKPRAYEGVTCPIESGQTFNGLYWSRAREEFIEPITGQSAEPVIGRITGWRYPDPDPETELTPGP